MKANHLLSILLSALLFSCGLSNDQQLEEKLRQEITSGKKTIEFEKLTNFEWENLLILGPYSQIKNIEKELDVDLCEIEHFNVQTRDDVNLIVFMVGRQPVNVIVYPHYPGDFSGNASKLIPKSDANFEVVVVADKKTKNGEQWIDMKLNTL
ncbi:hypothetical protein [Flammeovirga sp. SJP92]|uniref:hypothetical protein n=1 Tax=Flammeovirga sp. SJP92 TaxID=1775430 RepID=UPI0007868B2A|nr:hypothetical protein [Flammeovirga sp. SJP92]KXX70805.1 hypothetical protein AVL50_11515 [Flammeovirga sp. SJP92]